MRLPLIPPDGIKALHRLQLVKSSHLPHPNVKPISVTEQVLDPRSTLCTRVRKKSEKLDHKTFKKEK